MFSRRLFVLVVSASLLASTTSQSESDDVTAKAPEASPDESEHHEAFKTASLNSDNPLLRSSSSHMLMVSQGEKLSLFCESQEAFDYCKWKNLKTQVIVEGRDGFESFLCLGLETKTVMKV